MRPTTYDAFWCAQATARMGVCMAVLGVYFVWKDAAPFALACFVPAAFAFAAASIVYLWARNEKADEDARIVETLDVIGKTDTVAAQRLRELRDEMLYDENQRNAEDPNE